MGIKRDIRMLSVLVKRIGHFISVDMWNMDLSSLSKLKATLVRDLQIGYDVLKKTAEGAIGFQSVALAYFSIMATIPFFAVFFAVTNGFGMAGWLEDSLTSFLNSSETVDQVMTAAGNILALAKSGGFGIISALMFIWLVIWMMMRVEKVFNNVWGVKKPDRKFIVSFGVELAILIIAPLALTFFFMGSVFYSNIMETLIPGDIIIFADKIRSFLGWVIFCALIILLFSAMYKWIPAAKVKYRYALRAAIIAGIAFTALQYIYIETQLMVTRINAVYGVIAVIPLFMLWLRYVWLIIIYGAQVSNSFQTIYDKEEVVQ
ncbi:MAG: YihY/virulence factor BrkB family protein [Bacteroidales bacterium]|nr:YihY/virulence factor BrkB family protein [Bacteroidales bacterium]MBQ4306452.1 YihY/virulence factor BrkB family protein [Bacteroidales bacterium]